jgi:hypothetical protein
MGSLNNAFSNALDSLLGNINGVLTGRNPLTQPQLGTLFGFNVPGKPLISTRDYFLLQLESWLSSVPLQSQWIILIQPFPSCINTKILQGLERTGGNSLNYNINEAKNILTSYPYQNVNGCIFAQSVQLPDETMNIEKAFIQNNRGFLPGILGAGRTATNQLSIGFLETNTSFIDFVIRPWVIAGEHFGFVARENDTVSRKDPRNVKSTIYVLEYTRTYQHVSMIPRKTWTFFNCAPISVQTRNLGYDEPITAPTITTTWTYTDYAISNAMHLPLPNLINRISNIGKGKFPKITTLQKKKKK